MSRRGRIFGEGLDRDVVELVLEQEGLVNRRVNCGQKDSFGREIEISGEKRVLIWMFQACTLESVDKAYG